MSDAVREYLSASPSTRLGSLTTVQAWLSTIESQALVAFGSLSDSLRAKVCRALVTDLGKATGRRLAAIPSNSREPGAWSPEIRLLALKVLKELSRLPGGGAPLSEKDGLEALLLQLDFPPARTARRRRTRKSGSSEASSSSPPPSQLSSSPSFAGTISRALRRPKTPSSGRKGSDSSPRTFSNSRGVNAGDSDESGTIDEEPLSSPSSSPAADWAATDMALRCLNNALFLNESSRLEFAGDEIDGGRAAVALLANPNETPVDVLFLGARLLFFSTLFESPFNKVAVESYGVVQKEAECVRALVRALRNAESPVESSGYRQTTLAASGTPTQLATALSDVLKAHFNLCLYYPRLASSSRSSKQEQGQGSGGSGDQPTPATMGGATPDRAIAGEGYHEALDDMLEPTLETVASLPLSEPVPLIAPMTHAIAALLNYPLEGRHHQWASRSLDEAGLGLSAMGNDGESNGRHSPPSGSPPGGAARKLAESVTSLFSSGSSLSGRRGSKSTAVTSAQEQSRPRPAGQTQFAHEISSSSTAALEAAPPLLSRLLIIADRVLGRYLSAATAGADSRQGDAGTHSVEDPDSKQVRAAANRDGVELEDTVPPLILLLRKLASEDADFRRSMRSILLPDDLDRSQPLDKRIDLLGRLVRLMSSVILTRTARAAGELLLAICDGDPRSMTDAIGYGPCAGFLMNNGLASALPSSTSNGASAGQGDSNGRTINPITGQYDPTAEELAADINAMTPEEKEREAEKLFVLFDRLNKTGVVKVQDPRETMRQRDGGRFEEVLEEEERRKVEEEEEDDERTVEREMAELKRRKAEARRRAQKLAGGSKGSTNGSAKEPSESNGVEIPAKDEQHQANDK